ncbi:DUF6318 family protein [Cellulosimicrobium cellulans]|uniref:DUF6318 family protein n=1 Tax=Cellulosimicrobium cellulans TaxID=1710 RepID=UPI0012FE7CF9|nr:DUF6318 family protein [Cellulosimicrobium cellulans]
MGVVVAVGWVVAGCTGGGGPGPSPSVDEPVVPSPSESEPSEPSLTETGPAKPERPAAMDRDDAEGAAAAAEYFLSLYGYVLATGDTAEWDAMTWVETCEFCANVRADAEEIAGAGDTYEGAEITISAVTPGELDTFVGAYPVVADFQQAALVRTSKTGEVLEEQAASSGRLQIDLLHDGTSWRVLSLTVGE